MKGTAIVSFPEAGRLTASLITAWLPDDTSKIAPSSRSRRLDASSGQDNALAWDAKPAHT
jgi:hypothetical protein